MNKSITSEEAAELATAFKNGKEVSIGVHNDGIWDYTVSDIYNRIKSSRIFKGEKNPSSCYWLGRLKGKREIQQKSKQISDSYGVTH